MVVMEFRAVVAESLSFQVKQQHKQEMVVLA
jgi:hypothetical protein